tara:strand:- start:7466 stop:7654 length:189 start_codon:yes stop_codon:yes gene_type:complete
MVTIDCETKTKISNKKTGVEYESEELVQADISNTDTATKEEDIQRDVTIIVPQLDLYGKTNE